MGFDHCGSGLARLGVFVCVCVCVWWVLLNHESVLVFDGGVAGGWRQWVLENLVVIDAHAFLAFFSSSASFFFLFSFFLALISLLLLGVLIWVSVSG